jgi:hypothetical protein
MAEKGAKKARKKHVKRPKIHKVTVNSGPRGRRYLLLFSAVRSGDRFPGEVYR